MLTITIDGSATGRIYYGLSHALPVARRMATIRARKGQHPGIAVIEVASGAVVVADVTQLTDSSSMLPLDDAAPTAERAPALPRAGLGASRSQRHL